MRVFPTCSVCSFVYKGIDGYAYVILGLAAVRALPQQLLARRTVAYRSVLLMLELTVTAKSANRLASLAPHGRRDRLPCRLRTRLWGDSGLMVQV